MCINSLRKGECFSEDCRFNHVKGTKRHPPAVKSNTRRSMHADSSYNQNPASNQNPPPEDVRSWADTRRTVPTNPMLYQNPVSNHNPATEDGNNQNPDHFLEVIRLLKAEILQTFDQKMASITNQISVLQNQQMQMKMPLPTQMPMTYSMQPPMGVTSMRPHLPPPMFMMPNQQATQSRVPNPTQQ